jgi:hypothetical protein
MKRVIPAALLAAAILAVAIPATAPAAEPVGHWGAHGAYSKRCAWWNLRGDTDTNLVIDAYTPETTCKAAKAVGDAYLNASGWHPQSLRAAGKTWRLQDHDDNNGGDDCANRTNNFGLPYSSYKTNNYVAKTRRGQYLVGLEYDWVLEDQENCSGY